MIRFWILFIYWLVLTIQAFNKLGKQDIPIDYLPMKKLESFPGIYFNVVSINSKDQARVEHEFKSWGNNVQIISNSVYRPVYRKPLNLFPETTLVYQPPIKASSQNGLLFAFRAGMRDFLNNTNLRWFARVVDDEYVDLPNLATFINDLESKFDPLKVPIVKGHYCRFFLHGGSGWLLSRKSVEMILDIWNTIPVDFSRSDDHHAIYYFEAINVSHEEMQSPRFLASYLKSDPYYHMLNNWTDINRCPINQYLNNMSDVAFWHASDGEYHILDHGYELMRTMPKFVHGEFTSGPIGFCK